MQFFKNTARAALTAAVLIAALTGCNQNRLGNMNLAADYPSMPDDGTLRAQRYIVKLAPSNTAQEFNQKNTYLMKHVGWGATVEPLMDSIYSVKFPAGQDIGATVKDLAGSSNVEYVEPDATVYANHTPNDPQFSSQWAHQVIQSEKAWDITMGSKKVVVAIVDTGMDYTHPDLAANVWTNPGEIPGNGKDDDGDGYVDDVHGWNFNGNTNDPMADDSPHYHGTHTAGSVGAIGDNNTGVIGHSPNVTIMPLKFLGADGSGQVSDAIKAINFAVQKKVNIISNSWGGGQFSQALQDAINAARSAGILFVVAAGNGNSQGIGQNNDVTPTYPANYPLDNIISVAASTQSDTLTSFSNYGARTVHIAAPGENILSTKNGGQYQYMSGTSMATPLVSGVVAMMEAIRPDMTYLQIKNALLNSVDVSSAFQGKVVSNGRINAYKALSSIFTGPTPVPSPTPIPSPTPVPSPTPIPSPTPVPTPPPSAGIANIPLLLGQPSVKVTNPQQQIPITYDISNFPNATMVYLEISKANTPFSSPNGTSPDPNRLLYAENPGLTGQFMLVPAQNLPGWGTYYFRVIPLTGQQGNLQPVGKFSDSATLFLQPQ